MNEIVKAYLQNRKELRAECAELLQKEHVNEKCLEAVFWEDFLCKDDKVPFSVSGAALPEKKFNAADFFSAVSPEVETVDRWKRLCVTETWMIRFAGFATPEDWFGTLSQTNRKKLRWMRNQGMTVRPLESEKDFDDFEALYSTEFPKHFPNCEENRAVRIMYRHFIEQGRNFSRMLFSREGKLLAACLAYQNGPALYYTHLTRSMEKLNNNLSPGNFITYSLICEMLKDRKEMEYFFLGPGTYGYKQALGGSPFPVFRYERNTIRNLFGLIRLYHRAAKERRKQMKKH